MNLLKVWEEGRWHPTTLPVLVSALTWSEASESQQGPRGKVFYWWIIVGWGERESWGGRYCRAIPMVWNSRSEGVMWKKQTMCPNGILDLHYLGAFMSLQQPWYQTPVDQSMAMLRLPFRCILPSGCHNVFKPQPCFDSIWLQRSLTPLHDNGIAIVSYQWECIISHIGCRFSYIGMRAIWGGVSQNGIHRIKTNGLS